MTESVAQMAKRLGIELTGEELRRARRYRPVKPTRGRGRPAPPASPQVCTLGPTPALSGSEAARELARAWIRGGEQKMEGQHLPHGWLELGGYQRHSCGVRVREARTPDLRWGLIDRTDALHRCPA